MTFINLHVHDEYSQLDGFGKAEDYAERAKILNQLALASTNHGNIDGLIKHQKACKKEGIKPILGCELYVVPNPVIKMKEEKKGHMVVLVKNHEGWKALCSLLTMANLEGFYNRPRVGFEWIRQLPQEQIEGLVFMTACLGSFLKIKGGKELFLYLSHITEVFLEVQPWPSKEQVEWNKTLYQFSLDYEIPLVATNDTHYILPKDSKAQEVLLAIQRKKKWNDLDRFRFEYDGLHLRSEREMVRSFHKHDSLPENVYREAIERTSQVAGLCDFTIPKMEISLPKTKFESESSSDSALWNLIQAGIERKGGIEQAYLERVEEEFKIIKEKNFSRYFLVIFDLVNWCKKNNILVGPGRGSVGGSLVSYLLNITEVDPIEYGLLFSRFINPDRNDYPDIDLDIETRRRDEARIYLESTYGLNSVCGISTFNTMKGKGVLRDVSRVFDIPLKEVDYFSKSIEGNIKDACETDIGREFCLKHPEVIESAQRLENQIRSSGQHPAAIVITDEDLSASGRGVIVERNGSRVINWDMEDSEYVGVMKIDALRLDTLSIISEAVSQINIQDESIPFDFEPLNLSTLELNDENIFQKLTEGKTSGVFQLAGYACKKLCIDMGVHSFNDIVAISALSRPGPFNSGMTSEYVSRKKGKPWDKKIHPYYYEIVKDTFGVLVYQEQVMKVFTNVAGLPAGTADTIRKIIGKKRDAKEFEPYRIKFIEGCLSMKTFTEKEANEFWEGLLEWASYGFNLSHAVQYSIISYRTAFLKYNYPIEYLAAYLSYGEQSQKEEIVRDILEFKEIKITSPKVGVSHSEKWVVKDGWLYMPFCQVNGIGIVDAEKCNSVKPVSRSKGFAGFFNLPQVEVKKEGTKLQNLLEEIKAFDLNPESMPEKPKDFFEIDLNLFKGVKVIPQRLQQKKTYCEEKKIPRFPLVQSGIRYRDLSISNCSLCKLPKTSRGPVLSSIGYYNVAIVNGSPGLNGDDSNKFLWEVLNRYGWTKRQFYLMDACKCDSGDVSICKNHLFRELESIKCTVVLALGVEPLKAFIGKEQGINELSGKTDMIDIGIPWKMEVCWCISPDSSRSKRELFVNGIQNFSEVLKLRIQDIPF